VRRHWFWPLLLLLLAMGCARPAKERAERDLEIGKVTSGDLRVSVAGGLAAVRSLEPGRLVLWSSAPAWEIEFESHQVASVRLEVENCLLDVELTALTPGAMVPPGAAPRGTRKYWDLRLPAGRSQFRLASPDVNDRGTFKFGLLSDVQEAVDRVQDIYRTVNAEPDLRFLLGAGDLTERGSVAELSRFHDELESLDIPYYTTLGNHELDGATTSYQQWFGRGNFQFVFRGVYFTMLDSASATLDPLVYDLLSDWLDRGRSSVHVVAMHIPPLDPIGVRNGAFASRAEAAALLADFAEHGVDATLYGHIHSYYEFHNAGIPAFISGGGGAIPERFDGMGRHFMVIEVNADSGVQGTRVVRVFPED
jgi:3',5'-cyclic-AMP phosphodiesterase